MSSNFERVKRDILKEMHCAPYHTASSWADIMLRNTAYLTTEDDQKEFWKWSLNPSDLRDQPEMKFVSYNPENIEVGKEFKVKRNGLTEYITTQEEEEDEKKCDA